MRQLDCTWALLAGLVGLGYVYVGRLGWAVALLLGSLASLAVLSWTRLIFDASVAYVFVAIGGALGLLQIIHPVAIAARQKEAASRRYNRWWFYGLWVLGGALAMELLLAIRGSILGYETFRIPAASMAPTLEPGDMIIVDTWHYRTQGPDVGDIIVFDDPTGITYAKRVVAVPGDQLEIREGVVYRNQLPISEPYLHALSTTRPYGRDKAPIELDDSQYYVLGDYRDNSRDSRIYGPISRNQVRGRVEYIMFSSSEWSIQWHRFPRYFD